MAGAGVSLLGTVTVGLGLSQAARAQRGAGSAPARSSGRSFASLGALIAMQGHGETHRQIVSSLWDFGLDGRRRRADVDPRRLKRCRSS